MELNRKNRLVLGLLVVAVVLLAKLFYIQIINDKYKRDADNNSLVYNYIYPPRGIIFDRNGQRVTTEENEPRPYDPEYVRRLMMGLMMTGMAMTKLNVVMLEAVFRPYMANR